MLSRSKLAQNWLLKLKYKSIIVVSITSNFLRDDNMRREELLSLRLHEAVALKLKTQPEFLNSLPKRLKGLSEKGQLHPYYLAEWQAWLDLEETTRLSYLGSEDEYWVSLRQSSPFAGFLSSKERQVVLKNFKKEWSVLCGELT